MESGTKLTMNERSREPISSHLLSELGAKGRICTCTDISFDLSLSSARS